MAKRFKINRKSKWVYSLPTLIVLVIVVGISVEATFGMYSSQRDARAEKAQVEQELNKLSDRQEKLQAEVTQLNTRMGKEAKVREKFSVAKTGEEVIILVDEENDAEPAPDESDDSWWSRLGDMF